MCVCISVVVTLAELLMTELLIPCTNFPVNNYSSITNILRILKSLMNLTTVIYHIHTHTHTH